MLSPELSPRTQRDQHLSLAGGGGQMGKKTRAMENDLPCDSGEHSLRWQSLGGPARLKAEEASWRRQYLSFPGRPCRECSWQTA